MSKARIAAAATTIGLLAGGLAVPQQASAGTPDPTYVVNCLTTQARTLLGGGPPDPGCQLGPLLGALGL